MQTDSDKSVLLEAQGFVHGDRQTDYGHPLDNYTRVARIWTAMLAEKLKPGETIDADLAVLMLAGMKIGRELGLEKRDNRTDIAGYAEVLDMCKRERARRELPEGPQ